jgi:hypothetical protein
VGIVGREEWFEAPMSCVGAPSCRNKGVKPALSLPIPTVMKAWWDSGADLQSPLCQMGTRHLWTPRVRARTLSARFLAARGVSRERGVPVTDAA